MNDQSATKFGPAPSAKSGSSYKQPTKNSARILSLAHAVTLLTVRRDEAAVVPANYVAKVKAALLASDVLGDAEAAAACEQSDISSWQDFRASSVGTRTAAELTVAYLAGPEPSNDLLALVALGLRPENIWAFEIDPQAIATGMEDLKALGLRGVKFVPVSMDDYLIGTPRRFDIIYFDACGPLPSDKQKTIRLIVDIFKYGALAPLGVLISNFSRPDISKPNTLNDYASLVASYLFPKGFVEAEGSMIEGPPVYGYKLRNPTNSGECFLSKVEADFDGHYGAFITRQIMDIAEIVAPTVRLTSSKLHKVLFDEDLEKAATRGRRFARFNPALSGADEEDAVEQVFGAKFEADEVIGHAPEAEIEVGDLVTDVETDGDAIVDPSFFSLVWTLAALGFYEIDENFDVPSTSVKNFARAWKNQLYGSPAGGGAIEDLIAAFYAWRHDKSLWSPAMKAIGSFPYREAMPFLCDIPSEELGFYPAFAQLAYPTHPNVREARRWRYVAEGKTTPMFLDVIAFDECRYVYDWLSAMHLVTNDWLDRSAQLTFRFALDAIVKERRWFGDDFLYGCHAVGEDHMFPTSELSQRIDLPRGQPPHESNNKGSTGTP
ncbi:class I SAM-dependent methyltransferase [Paracoccus marcusii]|uniref:class I SAM-dependent methyltransferase n=1 Tax=Paracoccus marcusii TaxID=59779 RepID=UPI00249233A1|nr:class I SAM-dependent methyltransferase [Paracoccus marcusii]